MTNIKIYPTDRSKKLADQFGKSVIKLMIDSLDNLNDKSKFIKENNKINGEILSANITLVLTIINESEEPDETLKIYIEELKRLYTEIKNYRKRKK